MATGTAVEVVMPQMGVSVSEGTVTKWMKNVGDTVQADETVLEISTDKVDTEIPSPATGVLSEILVAEGETVDVGTVLARIESAGGDAAPAPPAAEAPPPAAPEPQPAAEPEAAPEPQPPRAETLPAPMPPEVEPVEEPSKEPGDEAHDGHGQHVFVSPVVARIAAEHGIDPAEVEGTGRGGRVTKKDILAFVEETSTKASEPAAPAQPTAAAPTQPQPERAQTSTGQEAQLLGQPLSPGETTEPLTAMRRGIAEHMRRSLDTSAHVTSAIEVDMSKVVAIREKLKPEYQAAYGINPTYLAFIARATVETLRDWPWVNAELRGDSIVTKAFVNLGFAVALEGGKGLIVPVVKNAEGLNLVGMARAIADVADRARNKRLLPDDVTGGTFTITNPGSFGTFMGTPVISQPQSAILGTYAVVKRAWVVADDAGNDAIAIRSMMNLTLTYDHRLVDGAYGGQFLRDLRERLESWDESAY
jgi:pyruvate dehydrogenase E2 component (dihydrolipoamide acetyltransferase)